MRRLDAGMRHGLYRSRQGVVFGVCKGIAEYFNFSVFWARTIAVLLLFFTGFWPVIILYILAGLLMKPEPVIPTRTEAEKEFYDSYTFSRQGAVQRLKQRFDNLDRRIQRIEHVVTTREFDWNHRMNE